MKVFITGATGYLGRAVARQAADAGHHVRALARTPSSAKALEALGYEPVLGTLEDLGVLTASARDADASIHLANTGDESAAQQDRDATLAMAAGVAGSGKPFLYTSGVWVLGTTGSREAGEDAPVRPVALVAWRAEVEAWLAAQSSPDTRLIVVRPGIVHGDGGGIPGMMAQGTLPVMGDGNQRWPLVHRDDLADLYLKAVERAPAGAVLHGTDDHATMAQVADAVVEGDVPRMDADQALEAFGPFAEALLLDQLISSRRTRELTGWTPREPSLVKAKADIATGV